LSIAHIAAGRLDGFFEAAIHIWDCAAAVLILKESGGEAAFAFEREQPNNAFGLVAGRRGVLERLREIVEE
jgi:myo-inositol-1(or 4)-monophosphatase